MNIEKLKYVVEVAKTSSIKLASENLHVTQSAISQGISSIEKELGVRLFSRSRGQDSRLTEEGKGIVQKAYEVLNKYEELHELAQIQNVKINGELTVCTTAGYMNNLIDPLSEFKDLYPNVRVKIIEKANSDVIECIQQQKYDVGLIAAYGDLLSNKDNLEFHLLFDGRAQIYASKDSLLSYNQTVNLKDLQGQSLIAYQGSYTQQFIKKYSEIFQPMDVLFDSNNTETILNAVSAGLGYTIAYDFLMNKNPHIKSGQIKALDIIDEQEEFPLNISFGWIQSKNKHISLFTKKLLKIIENSL